uniref:Uncharacterized protein n=1 Tax=Arundo donax TaxID=35708 RepID=A0A0A9HCC2_ARUDO
MQRGNIVREICGTPNCKCKIDG